MKRQYQRIALALISFLFCTLTLESLDQHLNSQIILQAVSSKSSESQLARGEKLLFSKLGQSDLEMLPGLSSTLSKRIIESREMIIEEANTLSDEEQFKALELVYGIGVKTAKKLQQWIQLDLEAQTKKQFESLPSRKNLKQTPYGSSTLQTYQPIQ